MCSSPPPSKGLVDLPASDTRTGWLLQYEAWLRLLARKEIDSRFAGKFDASDAVQQTLLEAWKGWDQCRGTDEPQRLAWLRQILTHTLANAARDWNRDKRDVTREQSLQLAVEQSSARLEAWLADDASSPSQRAARHEELLRLADALAALPGDQGEALTLYYLHGLSLEELGDRMGRSSAAAAGLIKRGLRALRGRLHP